MTVTLETTTSRIGRGSGGPLMLSLTLNTDRDQDALRASVMRRRPGAHSEDWHDTEQAIAAEFPGAQKVSEVEIPIPHADPYRVAAVLKLDSVAAIQALRDLLDEAEAALTEKYPDSAEAVDEAAAARDLSCQALSSLDPDSLMWHGRTVVGFAAEIARRGAGHVDACSDNGHVPGDELPTVAAKNPPGPGEYAYTVKHMCRARITEILGQDAIPGLSSLGMSDLLALIDEAYMAGVRAGGVSG